MAQRQFRSFKRQLGKDAEATLQQFLGLQVLGSQRARRTLSQLQARQAESPRASDEALMRALEVLESTDLRSGLGRLSCPVLWLAGVDDQLVPAGAARESAGKLHQSRVECLPGAGHAPFISHETQVLSLIDTWFAKEFS